MVLVTPYNKDHTSGPGRPRAHAAPSFVRRRGGFRYCGSTGDMGLLDSRERESLFREAKKGLAGSGARLFGGVTLAVDLRDDREHEAIRGRRVSTSAS